MVLITRLFETGVMSILNYGAEIWGYGNYPKCDTIMNRAMRYFVGVHRFAPTAGVVGDMGWLSLKYKRYIVMLRFWNRLIKMNDNRITKRIFLWFYDRSDNNWCYDISRIANELDMSHVYNNKLLFTIVHVQEQCLHIMESEWKINVQGKPKLRMYKEFKGTFSPEPYIVKYMSKHIRSLFGQIRIGILPIRIESGRFTNILDEDTGMFRKLNINERICNLCNMNAVEDETHFILYCRRYTEERHIFINKCLVEEPRFHTFSDMKKLWFLMNIVWRQTALYISEIWRKRSECELI